MGKWLFVTWVLVWFGLGSVAVAQNEEAGFIQTQLDAVFLMNEDSVTALYSISYIQPPRMEEVHWIFSIPQDATRVEIAPTLITPIIQHRTDPIIEAPELTCELNPTFVYGHGFLPYVDYLPPDDATVTEFDDAQSALDWMAEVDIQPADKLLSGDGTRFVGMSITPQSDIEVGDYESFDVFSVNISATLLVEYPGSEPYFPLDIHASQLETHLDNYDQTNFMPVTAYVFADTPYEITNFEALHPDLSDMTSGSHVIRNIMRDFDGTPIFFNALDPAYYQRLYNAVHEVEGMGFIREYTGDLDDSVNVNFRDSYPETVDLLENIAENYPVVSRFRTFLRDEYVLPEPEFEPASQDALYQLRLADEVDPAEFYGCSTRTLYDAELEARLPEGRTYLEDLQVHVAHPEGWIISEPRSDLIVLASEAITREMLRDVELGQEGPPMFVFQRFEQDFINGRYGYELPDETWQPFTLFNNDMPTSIGARNAFTIYYPSTSPVTAYSTEEPGSAEGVHLAIVTTHEDYAENHALYEDMLTYVATRQFWLSPELRHTLFIDGPTDLIQIGYPENWIETFDENGNRLILPERMHPEAAPFIRVRDLPEDWSDFESWVMMAYNPFINPDFFTSDPPIPVPFTRNGRRGYVLRANSNPPRLVEVSAPEDHLEIYQDLLQTIAQAIIIHEPDEE